MKTIYFQRALLFTLAFQIALAPTLAYPRNMSSGTTPAVDEREMRNDKFLAYFGKLDVDMPQLTSFALGAPLTETPIPAIADGNPLLDSDPFFMRTQNWETNAESNSCGQHLCFSKNQRGELLLSALGGEKALRLKRPLTPILETESYVILSADSDAIFRQKAKEANPGEGLFFISKRSLVDGAQKRQPVPVFFFPLPDDGWTGKQPGAFDFIAADQIVVHDKRGFALPIEKSDFAYLEKIQRDNLVIAQMFSFMEGKVDARGVALPKANSTLLFGSILSGQTPDLGGGRQAVLDGLLKFQNYMRDAGRLILPEANAKDEEAEALELMRAQIQTRTKTQDLPYWRKWVAPTIAYGGTAAAAAAIYVGHPIDWSTLITADMPQRIATVGKILGAVGLASVLMRYTVHKTKLDTKYKISANDSWLEWVNKHHKAMLDELTHGLYFSVASIPQGIRHVLEFFKDHFMPSNKMVHKAWDATMGWQMRQNSRLAMNWKTFYLGALVFGMADSVLVGVHLLLFTPFLMDHFGIGVASGAVTAAYASSEVLRNFLGYLQGGAHSYSAEVKFIHMQSAEKEAKRQLELQGIDPNSSRSADLIQKIAENEVEKRFKTVGLPGQDEFLYDPISALEKASNVLGYSVDKGSLTPEQTKTVESQQFVLAKRRWGLVQPALRKALQTAKDAQKNAPSKTGLQTIALLEYALKDRSLTKSVAGRAWDTLGSKWAADGFKDSVNHSMTEYLAEGKSATWLGSLRAATRGAFRYLALDSTKEVRDIREVLYLMSTSGNPRDLEGMLPDSWRAKAGSEEAALLGAELFHRAFFAYYEGQPELITPTAELDGRYGARARKILARLSSKQTILSDSFVYQIRYWQTLYRLKAKDQERNDLLTYKPKALKGLAAMQWARAKARAIKIFNEDPIDEQVAREWQTMAERYQEDSGVQVDTTKWAHSYRFKTLMAQQFAKVVGLSVNNVENSEFVKRVVIKAAAETESQLGLEKEQTYISRIQPDEREFHEAQVFTQNFINAYVSMSVATDEMSAGSPEYPGRFQAVRRALVDVPGGKIASKAVRFFEAMFRNEETAYKPGFWSFLDRSLPFVPDMAHNFFRSLRTLPYVLSFSWLTSYYIWQIHIPFSLWAVFAVMGFWGAGLIEFNNRVQRNLDKKPMGDVPSKLFYSFVHSTLTNPEVMVLQAYADPIAKGFDGYVTEPIKNLAKGCEDILKGSGSGKP